MRSVRAVLRLALAVAMGCATAGAPGGPEDGGGPDEADAADVTRGPDAEPGAPDAAARPDAPPEPPDAAPPPPPMVDAAPPPPPPTPDAAPPPCTTTWLNLLANPGFDSGTANWSESSSGGYPLIGAPPSGVAAHSAPNVAWMGGYDSANDQVWQVSIAVPASATMLRLKGQRIIGTEESGSTPYDFLTFRLRNAGGTPIETLATFSNADAVASWTPFEIYAISSYAGMSLQLHIQATTDIILSTGFLVDSLALEALVCI